MTGAKKPLVILACIACLVLGGWAFYRFTEDPYDLPPRNMFVCVATGELFELSPDEAGMIPARNTNTGERTLLPCVVGTNGVCRVGERYRSQLDRMEDVNHYVDPHTVMVTTPDER